MGLEVTKREEAVGDTRDAAPHLFSVCWQVVYANVTSLFAVMRGGADAFDNKQ